MSNEDTTPAEYDGSVEHSYVGRIDGHIASNAAALRRMADKLDRIRTDDLPKVTSDDEPDRPLGDGTYGEIAAQVQHTVLWGLANLNLDSLSATAGSADKFRERRMNGRQY